MNITNSIHPSTVRPVALALILGVLGVTPGVFRRAGLDHGEIR